MSRSRHLSSETIASFPTLPHAERLSLFAHAQECRTCSSAFLTTWNLKKPAAPSPPVYRFTAVLDRVARVEANLSRERDQAAELLRELLRHPHARRQTLIRNSRRFLTWGLCEGLLARSKELIFSDLGVALELAQLAQEVSIRLDAAVYGDALVRDFRCRAWAALGNALLAVGDLHASQAALDNSAAELDLGTGDPLLEAQLLYYRGCLRGAQRRFEEAVRDFDRASAIHARAGDRHLQAKDFIAKGNVLAKAGDPNASIALQRQALEMIDVTREPRVLLAAHHNLLADYIDCGRNEEALQLLENVRALHEGTGERVNYLRLMWIEAQLRQQIGDLDTAEHLLLEVRHAFSEMAVPYDVALASLQLATLYAEQGRTSEIKRLALEMLPVFQALEIQRETIAALILFRQAAEAETATLALIQHIAGFLKRAQHDPAARFSPPS
jgi:tetratricopeptide (TPR) repeat protein